MFDLSKAPFNFPKKSAKEIVEHLQKRLPPPIEVTAKEGKYIVVSIRDGLWKEAVLSISSNENQCQLLGLHYFIPSFMAKLILFGGSIVIFSVLVMVIAAIALGEFVPVIAGIGGLAGYAMYSIIKSIMLISMKNTWSPILKPIIETLNE